MDQNTIREREIGVTRIVKKAGPHMSLLTRMSLVFPAAYLLLVGFSLALRIEGLLMLLIIPEALIAIEIEKWRGTQFGDDLWLEIVLGAAGLFLIGLIVDLVRKNIKKPAMN